MCTLLGLKVAALSSLAYAATAAVGAAIGALLTPAVTARASGEVYAAALGACEMIL